MISEDLVREITRIQNLATPFFLKSTVLKMLSIHMKTKSSGVSELLRFEERFRKAPVFVAD